LNPLDELSKPVDMTKIFATYRNDAELAAVLRDSAKGEGLEASIALRLAVGLIDRLMGRVAILERDLAARTGPMVAAP
jgi:hypothetical protein